MKWTRPTLIALLLAANGPAWAVEGSTGAGPIGGNDIRSAQLPPPGVYGGDILLYAEAYDFVDGNGNTIPGLDKAELTLKATGPFLLYVPKLDVLGGSVGFVGVLPYGGQCGDLFGEKECNSGFGDLYLEMAWSRSFGKLRPSQFDGALPVFEGLSIMAGFGVVLPVGKYDVGAQQHGINIGNNLYDFAPALAFTYTTAPILADGTEFSAKMYWNNYLENPDTGVATGDVLSLDFAVTERIGRFQFGLVGTYVSQIEDDTIGGAAIPPDGRRAELLSLGAILNIDVPEAGGVFKIKALDTVQAENFIYSRGVVMGWAQKF
jgi:hypothetical protein